MRGTFLIALLAAGLTTERPVAPAPPPPPPPPPLSDSSPPCASGVARIHWVTQLRMSGALLVLDDGTAWTIRPADAGATALWTPGTRVSVLRDERAGGTYNYLLLDRDNMEHALAHYAGKRR
jgi:hypothetical protein